MCHISVHSYCDMQFTLFDSIALIFSIFRVGSISMTELVHVDFVMSGWQSSWCVRYLPSLTGLLWFFIQDFAELVTSHKDVFTPMLAMYSKLHKIFGSVSNSFCWDYEQHTITQCFVFEHSCYFEPQNKIMVMILRAIVEQFAHHIKSKCTATHCNTLQHTASHCNTLPCTTAPYMRLKSKRTTIRASHWEQIYSNTLQHTATHCNTRQHTATHCNTLH